MIKLNNINKSFGDKKLFQDFSLTIERGEFVILTGVSGCGKTTLLNMIGALEPFDSGEILVDGNNITKRKYQSQYFRTKVGFLFQNFALVDNKTVKENLKLVKNDCRTNFSIEKALDFVGLSNIINQKVYTLSGGEQQRVALARLMIKKCDLILADEPTGSLDRGNAEIVFGLLEQLNKQGKTIVVVTHDEKLQEKGKRVVVL
ncbi:MAG TPA: ATP-binding cassette domain-containing protein [Clostridia bacterium]|nr:ATP-binding cassette domain-containing protein [Clostridia bacterium]